MLCKAAINSVSHLFRAQWVCLKAQNSTIVATVKCLGHISWWGAQKEHIFISQSSLSPSLFANHSGLQLYTSLHHLSACMYVHQPELSLSLSTLFLFANHSGLQIYLSRSPQCLLENLSGPCWIAVSAYMYAPVTPWSPHWRIYFIHNSRFNL